MATTAAKKGKVLSLVKPRTVKGKKNGQRTRSIWRKLGRMSAITVLGTASVVGASFAISWAATRAWEWAATSAISTYRQTVRQLPMITDESLSIEELLDQTSAEMGFHPAILRSMAIQESGKEFNAPNRMKRELHLLRAGKKGGRPQIVPPKHLNDVEKEMWATSHGVLQVIFGFHYKECGLTPINGWVELHKPSVGIPCGAKVLKMFIDKNKSVKKQRARLWMALRDFNNSNEYANIVLKRADGFMDGDTDYGPGV